MRNIFLLFILFAYACDKPKKTDLQITKHDLAAVIIGNDTFGMPRNSNAAIAKIHYKYDSVIAELNEQKRQNFALKKIFDSVRTRQLINERKVRRIKRRIDICKKNPKLKTFFFGWCDRIVN
jgi:hypothetical protein